MATIGQTSFPTEIDTAESLLTPWSEYRGKLRLPCTSTDTRLDVYTTEGARPTGVLVIEDDNANREYVTYGGVTQDAFIECVRGAFPEDGGRAAAAWPAETYVDQTIVPTHHRVVTDALIAVEDAVLALQNAASGDVSITITHKANYGSSGTGNGQFQSPQQIAVDSSLTIYAADYANSRYSVWTVSGNNVLTWAANHGSSGTGNGQFRYPTGIAIGPNGNRWVADSSNHRIQRFSSAGTWQQTIGGTASGSTSTTFNFPTHVWVTSTNDVWVADYGNGRLQRYNSAGVYQQTITMPYTASENIAQPWGVAVDASGNIWATDPANNRIRVFTSAGALLTTVGGKGATYRGTGPLEFWGPRGIFIDALNHVLVADRNNDRVQVLDDQQQFLGMFGTTGTGVDQFQGPTSVVVDTNGIITVSDQGNNRLSRWQMLGSGYILKHTHDVTTSITYVTSSTQTVNATAVKNWSTACPSTHTKVIGGGCQVDTGTANVTAVNRTYPNTTVSPNTWVCEVVNSSGTARSAIGYAVCLDDTSTTTLGGA